MRRSEVELTYNSPLMVQPGVLRHKGSSIHHQTSVGLPINFRLKHYSENIWPVFNVSVRRDLYLNHAADKILEVGITDFEIWYHHFSCLREEDMALFLLSFT